MDFVPFFDWEDANHAVGAITGLINLGIGLWQHVKGEKDQKGGANKLSLTTSEGEEIQLVDVLGNHEERLARLEKPKRKRRRRT